MKTLPLSIIATVSISTAAILIFTLAVTTIPSNVHRSAPATISAESDAPTGTYWVILSPGQCNGGPILLIAVTKCSD